MYEEKEAGRSNLNRGGREGRRREKIKGMELSGARNVVGVKIGVNGLAGFSTTG
jgi:hypothetical protein